MNLGVRRALSRFARSIRPPGMLPAILMYHRVAEPSVDPWLLSVTPETFARHMRALRERRSPLSMTDFVARMRDGTLPRNAIAVTFDDGYLDNLANAKPLLEEFEIPATIFVASGFIGRREEFWWDELAKLFLLQPRDWTVADAPKDGALARLLALSGAATAASMRGGDHWDVGRPIWAWLRLQPIETIRLEMANLRAELGPTDQGPLERPMTEGELRDWLAGGLTAIAGHTVTHPVMTDIEPDQCADEIRRSVLRCAEIAGARHEGFAYPFGDRDESVATLLRDAGVAWACSTRSAPIRRNEPDFYDLPRIQVTGRQAMPWAI
jgi:peptidoglycan/xylan/chitin deacetylase (PgdA/CDA1 family)